MRKLLTVVILVLFVASVHAAEVSDEVTLDPQGLSLRDLPSGRSTGQCPKSTLTQPYST